MKSVLLSLGFLAATEGRVMWYQCAYGDGHKNHVKGWAKGIERSEDLASECLAAADDYGVVWDGLVESFTTLSYKTASAPFQAINDLLIEYTDMATACKYQIIFMQLKPRMSTYRGWFEVGMTFFQGGLAWTPLYAEGLGKLWDSDTCEDLGIAMGKVVRYGLIYEAPDAVFYKDVITNASTYINN